VLNQVEKCEHVLISRGSVDVFHADLVDQGLARWQSFDEQHLSDAKELISDLSASLNLVLHTLGQVLGGDSFEVTDGVVERNGKGSEHKLNSHGVFLFDFDGLVRFYDLVDVHQRIRMEHLVVTLPKDFRKVGEEIM